MVIAALVAVLPPSMAMAIQNLGSRRIVEPSAIHVALDPPLRELPASVAQVTPKAIQLPLRVTGIPDGYRMWADEIHFEIQSVGSGEKFETILAYLVPYFGATNDWSVLVTVTQPLLERWMKGPVRLRASALAALGGHPRTAALPDNGFRVSVPTLGNCVNVMPGPTSNCWLPFRLTCV